MACQVTLTLARDIVTTEAPRYPPPLRPQGRAQPVAAVLLLSWTVLHVIDDSSPLHGASQHDLEENGDELIVTIIGLDETMSQTVHGRHVYRAGGDPGSGARFVDILERGPTDGTHDRRLPKFPRNGSVRPTLRPGDR